MFGGMHSKKWCMNVVIWGMNGVGVDRHGLILSENEATGPGSFFIYFWDLRRTIYLTRKYRNVRLFLVGVALG